MFIVTIRSLKFRGHNTFWELLFIARVFLVYCVTRNANIYINCKAAAIASNRFRLLHWTFIFRDE